MLQQTQRSDPELYSIVTDELDRQQHNIKMIASESTATLEVLELSGCVFTNKTTEGYPGARFQAGSHVADRLENLAIARAKALFGAEHANLQPYSGSTANYGVYSAILKPGDLVFGMRLDQGGHLTHGSKVNFTSKFYSFMAYGVDEKTEIIDYDELERMAAEHKPKLIVAGGSAYPRLIDYKRMAVKRGIYSNEAGQGSGAIVAAAAECSHPATQGLVQIFSVYVDTLIICTASAVIILATGTYNVVDGTGATIVNNVPGVQYGILYVQQGLNASYSSAWAGKMLAVAVVMFVFTSLMGYYYQAESNVAYLFKDNSGMIWLFRGIFLASTFSGILINGEVLWSMSDIGVGLMAWINIIAILFLSASGVKILDDFERQKKEGTSLSFDPSAIIGFHDEAGVWTKK